MLGAIAARHDRDRTPGAWRRRGVHRRLPAGAGRHDRASPARCAVRIARPRLGRPPGRAGPARRGQFRHDDAAARGHPRRSVRSTPTMTGDASLRRRPMRARHRAARRRWARASARPTAARRSRSTAAPLHGDHLDAAGRRARRSRARCMLRRPRAPTATTTVDRAAADARSHGTRVSAFGLDDVASIGTAASVVSGAARRPRRAAGSAARARRPVVGAPSGRPRRRPCRGRRSGSRACCLNPHRLGFVRGARAHGRAVDVDGRPARSAASRSASFEVAPRRPRGDASIEAADVPDLIDELPVLAARAALGGRLEVSGAGELRVKESDRITALVAGLPRARRRRRRTARRLRHRRVARSRTAARRTRAATTASSWPSRWSGSARRGRRRSPAPTPSRCPTRASTRDLARLTRVTPDKIYLVGFMASGKSTVARALAARLRWQAEDIDDLIERRERRTIAEIFAQAGRAVLPRASSARSCSSSSRCATSSSRPAAARSPIPRTARSSTSTACRSGSTCRWPISSRAFRSTAAGRSRPIARELERLYAARVDAYRLAHVRVCRGARAGAGDRRSHPRGDSAAAADPRAVRRRTLTRALSHPERPSRQPAGARGRARRRAARSATTQCSCSAISSATAPIRPP